MPEPQTGKPALQKPPGYRDSTTQPPVPQPPQPRRPQPPRALRPPAKPIVYRRSRRRCCRHICCWSFAVIFTLLFFTAIAGALAYLWFQPRLPTFHLVSVQALHMNITTGMDMNVFNVSTALRIQAVNPNGRMEIDYGEMEARAAVVDEDGDIDLGSGVADGFVQGRRNATVVRFVMGENGVLVDDAVAARLKGRMKRSEVRVSVEMKTSVGVRVGGKKTGRVPIRVVCKAATLKQAVAGGGGSGGGNFSSKCRIFLFRWIDLH